MTTIREARPADVPVILQLIHDLALYEREPDAVRNTAGSLEAALFGERPTIYAHVAEAHGEVQGFALWFLNYSTWEGVNGIHLEDLYVRPEARGAGHGKALLANLARIATERWPERAEVQADGSVVVTARLTPGPYLYGWVLGFGADAEVIAPEGVRETFLKHVAELGRVYAAPREAPGET